LVQVIVIGVVACWWGWLRVYILHLGRRFWPWVLMTVLRFQRPASALGKGQADRGIENLRRLKVAPRGFADCPPTRAEFDDSFAVSMSGIPRWARVKLITASKI